MTVAQVDTLTGEIVAQPETLTAEQARALTDRIRGSLAVAYDGLVDAWQGRADLALGYSSWDAYCAGEFAEGRMVRLDREQRREIVSTMRGAGMSSRAIASATGLSQPTVARDVRAGESSDSPAAPVTGMDGKTYQPPAPRPITPSVVRDVVDEARREVEQEREDREAVAALNALAPAGFDRAADQRRIELTHRAFDALAALVDLPAPNAFLNLVAPQSLYRLADARAVADWLHDLADLMEQQ